MSFQTQVGYSWPAGNVGEFATINPRRMAVEPEMGFRAGAGGLTIGHFGWEQADGVTVLNKPVATEAPTGFVHRAQQGLATSYLQEATMTIPAGFMVTLSTHADIFAVATTAATKGQTVYASTTDGSIQTGAAGTVPSGTVATPFTVTVGGAAGNTIIISNPGGAA